MERTGHSKKDPQRRRKEPDFGGTIGDCPEYFNEAEKNAWNGIVRIALLNGLSSTDSLVVELAARLISRKNRKKAHSPSMQTPNVNKGLKYVKEVVSGKIIVCSLVISACKWHLDDLQWANVYPRKEHNSNKIDGVVALFMALGRAMAGGRKAKSVYEDRGMLVL